MGFANLLNQTIYISVEHITVDGSGLSTEGYAFDLGLAAVPVNIQPSSSEVVMLYGGAYGKMHTLFTTASGILETDRLTTVSGSDTTQYIVKGKQNFNYGLAQHIELYIEETQ